MSWRLCLAFLFLFCSAAKHLEAGVMNQMQTEPIRIIFAGDLMMDGSVKKAIRNHGADYPFVQIRNQVAQADYAVVNLETSVSHSSDRDQNQIYNFKSDSWALAGLKRAGFDMVSLANNHVLDYKKTGFFDTLRGLNKYGLSYVGAGRNEREAYSAKSVKLKGKSVKIAAFSRFLPTLDWAAHADKYGVASAYEEAKVLSSIQRESRGADYLIVFMHWGIERSNKPEQWQRELAHKMIDAGADAIIGSHPHVLQGFEFYKSKPIAYSIGNFLFPDYIRGTRADTGLLRVTLLNGQVRMSFDPYRIQNNRIVRQNQQYINRQLAYLEHLSYNVKMTGHSAVQVYQSN